MKQIAKEKAATESQWSGGSLDSNFWKDSNERMSQEVE
jgi:hypothetical protein